RFNGYDLSGFELPARVLAHARTFMNLQPEPMSRAVEKSLHAAVLAAGFVPLFLKKVFDGFVYFRSLRSIAHTLKSHRLPLQHSIVKLSYCFARAATHD